ncbi:MAG: carboxypeptidase-like regulatory domain-containing protein [Bacteroidales bacterium]|nr:carboxypeptidase-like regulatory domain-containing protein [Bacteroidales bacterium]
MKTLIHNVLRLGIIIIFMSSYGSTYAQSDNDPFVTINGILKDAKTSEKIIYATISIPGTGIGTVSNSDGEFTLKVSKASTIDVFEVSHLSYATTKFKISESLGKEKAFFLEPQAIMLKEISIIPSDARGIVEMALRNIKKNYSDVPNMMTGFYRETIKQRRDYLSISEAVVDIYKAAYPSSQNDQVKIYKGRKGTNVKKADTLMVQLQGGPNVSMLLDIVKNTDLSIALDNLDNYQFEFASMVNIDDKPHWVISFSPNVVKDEPLYFGKLFIGQDNIAITRAEFSLDLNDADKASRVFVQKKPMGLIFLPTSTSYLVTYKEQNGKYYLNYVRIDLKFRCDWKKRLFKNYYSVMSEVAITDRHEDNIVKFANQETFKANMVFADKVQNFSDPNFWGEYNIIQPEESIEMAIKKLAKSMKK